MTPQIIQPRFGERLKLARTRAKLTQREAAKRAKIIPVYLCTLEKGTAVPSMDCAARLADVLGTSLAWLMKV